MPILKRPTARLAQLGIPLEVKRNGHGCYLSDPSLRRQDCGTIYPNEQDAIAAAVAGARPTVMVDDLEEKRQHMVQIEDDGTITMRRLHDLARETDPNEDNPTEYAYHGILAFLAATDRTIPHASVVANEDGAIYVYWTRPYKKLQLTFPASADQQPYLYAREGDASTLLRDATPDQLAERFDWLMFGG